MKGWLRAGCLLVGGSISCAPLSTTAPSPPTVMRASCNGGPYTLWRDCDGRADPASRGSLLALRSRRRARLVRPRTLC